MERDSGRWKLVRRSNKKEEEIIEEDTTKKTLHSSGVPSQHMAKSHWPVKHGCNMLQKKWQTHPQRVVTYSRVAVRVDVG